MAKSLDVETGKIKTVRTGKPFYKKWWVWLIAVIVIIAIWSTGEEPATTGGITSEQPTEVATDSATKEEPAKVEEPKLEEVAPKVVFQNEQVILSFKELNKDGVKFLMENLTDKELTAQADSIAINGFSSNNIMMSDAVAPKSKGYITVQTDELADAGTPETLSGKLSIIDFESADMDSFEITLTNVPLK